MDELEKLRMEIDKIDDEIMEIISKRMNIVREIAKLKKNRTDSVQDKKREEEIYRRIIQKATMLRIDAEDAKRIFHDILESSRKLQKEMIK